jgi:hypothetical protein
MHDVDRTQLESWNEYEGFQMDEYEFMDEQGFYDGESGGPFSEADEMELAAELLEVSNESELDQFIGKLLSNAGRAIGRAVRSPVGRQIGGMLRGVARQALPMVGSALGNLALPGVGGAIGGRLASAAGSAFGLELEGLSPEDQQFEIARRVVRLGGEAVQQAALAPANAPPQAVARTAVLAAAQRHAPGLVSPQGSSRSNGGMGDGSSRGRRNGRWIRQGNRIILIGT